jgi:23S rRNA pseudouridine1911/1915/1917 synthase
MQSKMVERAFRIEVDELTDAWRLDQYLVQFLAEEEVSRSRIQKLIAEGLVLVDGKPSKPAARLSGGEQLSVTLPAGIELKIEAENIPLDVVFEDEHLIVVNKPAGMVTHPGAGVQAGTLVNALLFHCGSSLSGISGVLRPGIVHRLDKDTSGLLVVAKTDRSHHWLAEAIEHRRVKRQYLAVLEGIPAVPAATIDKPIGRHKTDRKKMAVVEGGRRAVTHYQVIREGSKWCLAEVNLETGRTHQIRVHMASIGTPVVGDIVYNRRSTGSEQSRRKLGLAGHALHAQRLSFTHPVTGRQMQLEAPLPADLKNLCESV